jgi:hypothetical protein
VPKPTLDWASTSWPRMLPVYFQLCALGWFRPSASTLGMHKYPVFIGLVGRLSFGSRASPPAATAQNLPV